MDAGNADMASTSRPSLGPTSGLWLRSVHFIWLCVADRQHKWYESQALQCVPDCQRVEIGSQGECNHVPGMSIGASVGRLMTADHARRTQPQSDTLSPLGVQSAAPKTTWRPHGASASYAKPYVGRPGQWGVINLLSATVGLRASSRRAAAGSTAEA